MLLDAISTLVEQMHDEINTPDILHLIVPPIIERWNSLKLTDPTLKNLTRKGECLSSADLTYNCCLECLSTLASELGSSL